jgi:hypothetical protein
LVIGGAAAKLLEMAAVLLKLAAVLLKLVVVLLDDGGRGLKVQRLAAVLLGWRPT